MSRRTTITLSIFSLILLGSTSLFAQNELYNDGALLHIEKGALLHVQGELINDGITGRIENDGVIEITGDFENRDIATDPILTVGADNTGERLFKFVGSADQTITGQLGTAGSQSFYNLLIDKPAAGQTVTLGTDIEVEGSLIWGSSTNANSYTPSAASTMTDNGGNGIIRVYSGGTQYEMYVSNANADAVAGYATLGSAATDGYVQLDGAGGVGDGGLSRSCTNTATDYVFPIGTVSETYNPMAYNFSTVGAGANKIRGLFVDGNVGTVDYERYWDSFNASCNGGAPQWVIFSCFASDHGYWSFDGDNSNIYTAAVYPNSMTLCTGGTSNTRLLKFSGAIGAVPTGDWATEVESVNGSLTDALCANTAGFGYAGSGMPGGPYQGFSHFQVASDPSSQLPVELLYLSATPIDNEYIKVEWETVVEIDNSGFEVQRSVDGVNFETVDWVEGNGTTTKNNFYYINDRDVKAGFNYYYRLNQIDYDGDNEITEIVSAELISNAMFDVSNFVPNPSAYTSDLMVQSTTAAGLQVELYNHYGQAIQRMEYEVEEGVSRVSFDLSGLESGTYHARISNGLESFTRSIVVQR